MIDYYERKGKIDILKADILKVGHHGSDTSTSDEFLDVVKLPFDEALRMVMDGTIKDSKTMIVIMKAWLLLNK